MRPPLPPVPHREPLPHEPRFTCRGPCALVWPKRFESYWSNRCVNCRRAAKRTQVDQRRQYLRKHGVTPEWVDEQITASEGKCPICACVLRKGAAVVDLCRKTHIVRGAICGSCSVLLEAAGDDTERLRRAAEYLEQPRVGAPVKPGPLPKKRPKPKKGGPRIPWMSKTRREIAAELRMERLALPEAAVIDALLEETT